MTRQILEMLTASRHIYNELMCSKTLNENLREKVKYTYENDFSTRMNIIIDLVNTCLKQDTYAPVNNADDAITLILTENSLNDEMLSISKCKEIIGRGIHSEKALTGQEKLNEAVNYLTDAKKSMIGYHGIAKMTGQV